MNSKAAIALVALVGCTDPAPTGPAFVPTAVFGSPALGIRGLLDRRGLIHAHSIYSHDACDGKPEVDGVRDEVCFNDFRRGICQVQHDFVMLTDHRDAFSETEFPDTLLYRADRGDVLVERNGGPTASWATCETGDHKTLILAGTETETMPVGLEHHVAPRDERSAIYGSKTPEAINMFKAAGAVALLQHTEDWSIEQLTELPIDGFEMYNLHANTFQSLGAILELLVQLEKGDFEGMPEPDLSLVSLVFEDPRYLERWGAVLASGKRRVTTMGTDCHRNSFQAKLADGERVDSYRRMMRWFSNHLLVRPNADGTWDDTQLKDALRAGRLYGAFEVFGYPKGFDYRAEVGANILEMGAEIPLSDAPELVVVRPTVQGLADYGDQPIITLRILKAIADGFEEVAAGDVDELRFKPTTPGAYRGEVRITPLHLREYLGANARVLSKTDQAWIYGNAIYVR